MSVLFNPNALAYNQLKDLFLENLKLIFNAIYENYLFGMAIGITFLLLVKLFSFVCRYIIKQNRLVSLFRFISISFAVRKINRLGFQALSYSPVIDGKLITVKDELENLSLNFKDPLNLEQDHDLRGYIYNKDLRILFFKNNNLSIKGYFHDLKTRQVYTGALIVEQNNDTND